MRCKPHVDATLETQNTARYADMVSAACRFIENADEVPALEEMARVAGASPAHFHRIFKSFTGLTPKAMPMHIVQEECAQPSKPMTVA